jgi:kumamolisin
MRILASPWGALGAWGGRILAVTLATLLVAGSAPAAAHLPTAARVPTASTTPGEARQSGPVRVGPTDPAQQIDITLTLAGRSQADIAQTISAIQDPNSPEYHHFLTPGEFDNRFGASAAAQRQVESVLGAAGLRTTPQASPSTLLQASGAAGQVEALFNVRLDDYRTASGTTYHVPEAAPLIPDSLRGVVTGVLGLDTRPLVQPATRLHRQAPTAPAIPALLGPAEIAQAYNFSPLHDAGLNGSGMTLAFAEIDTFQQSDIDAYDQHYNISAPAVQHVRVGRGASPADQVSETTLDIEVAHAVAPNAQIVSYEGQADLGSLLDVFNAAVSDTARHPNVLSISLGACELPIAQDPSGPQFFDALTSVFQKAAAEGMTVLVASGDQGAYTCHANDPNDNSLSISTPADNPWVTAVGGTALFVNSASDASRAYEAGWEGPLEGDGGGGGVSIYYPRPSWQTGPGVNNSYSTGKRQVPDIAAAADPLTGYHIYDSTGGGCSGNDCWTSVGGTSAAAPLWAGLVLLADQKAGKNLGQINPTLYKMGASGSSAFYDVTKGGNLYYQATSGWDYSTGWGTPNAAAVVDGLVAG